MKRIAGLFLSLLFLLIFACGCAVTLKSLKPGVDMDAIMKVVDALDPDEQGWKILVIPDKDFKNNGAEFRFFKKGEAWGYDWTNRYSVMGMIYNGDGSKRWIQVMLGRTVQQADYVSDEQAEQHRQEFMKVLTERGDFSNSHCYKEEKGGTSI